ncbi:hypothetical protein B0H17DRAFT_1219019 [Mycena rosella]|uniref:Uncharacterized protein n=1 Tax=Mycena rosella TaxID=1033263 RepID=A0AAD7FJS1_MYCRO|nr:hypothetical protein B0H17DRAFT_1219019 [Mycena rosella]
MVSDILLSKSVVFSLRGAPKPSYPASAPTPLAYAGPPPEPLLSPALARPRSCPPVRIKPAPTALGCPRRTCALRVTPSATLALKRRSSRHPPASPLPPAHAPSVAAPPPPLRIRPSPPLVALMYGNRAPPPVYILLLSFLFLSSPRPPVRRTLLFLRDFRTVPTPFGGGGPGRVRRIPPHAARTGRPAHVRRVVCAWLAVPADAQW